jgi:signal transduction histidine kinase
MWWRTLVDDLVRRDGTSRPRVVEPVAANDAARHSDHAQTAFLSMMSHELRTPLNAIVGFTEVVLQGLSGPVTPDQARQLGIVRDSAVHLRALIEDVLDISGIAAGQVGLEYADLDLRELASRSIASFAADASRKGIELTLDAPASSLRVQGDARRTTQIVNNLVSNAVKFTERGQVRVALQATAERVSITVTDTGIGIDAMGLARLFNPFTQVHRPGGRLHDGTGLGLARSRELARALGGDIEVRSAAGEGSCFTFWLPVAGHASGAALVDARQRQLPADWGNMETHEPAVPATPAA